MTSRVLVLVALLATMLVVVPLASPVAQAQESNAIEVWGIEGGITANPKTWQFAQSTDAANNIGSATAAAPGFDDSAWTDVELRWKTFPGPGVANHFRKDFTLDEIGVELFQVEAINVTMQYDDSAILYLNGVEVYRSIRGNLDPQYEIYDVGDDVPFDVFIVHGGAEEFYVNIPDPNGVNNCEFFEGCTTSPFGSPQPPAIPVDLLVDGVNTWAVTTWNQSGGGSGDSSLNHTFELEIDPDAIEPNFVFINEIMASNGDSYVVDFDGDLQTPDWFELINQGTADVNLDGWTIADNSTSWTFPSVVIEAGGYLVVAANDGDSTVISPTSPILQTNFKLARDGDSLKLTRTDGLVASEYVSLDEQIQDVSFGSARDINARRYLRDATPGAMNSPGTTAAFDPVIRWFVDRMYNVGESVSHQVQAFDPDGDEQSLSYALSPMPAGLSISNTGMITGTLTQAGIFNSTITVTDQSGATASQQNVTWRVIPAPADPAPIVLNEYNAVAGDRELLAGGPVGNGGDWYEFVVVEDALDLRGYTFELWDMKGEDNAGNEDLLRLASTVTIADDIRLKAAPAGTIVTISQLEPDDLDFNAQDDWHINFQIDGSANGTLFAPEGDGSVFNSTRAQQVVLIRNAAGNVVTPLAGETEAWDEANGGVSGAEVLSLCASPQPGFVLDPIADYTDNGASSSFGEPNTCELEPGLITTQSLDVLRATPLLDVGTGDTNCDGRLTVVDALNAAQFAVGNRQDSGPCFFDQGGPGFDISANAADITADGRVSVFDAVSIAQCAVGLPLPVCPQQ